MSALGDSIRASIKTFLRSYVIDGVQSSGVSQPTKMDGISFGNIVAAAVESVQDTTAALTAGIKRLPAVAAATTGALPSCTYANGTAGIGATLTADSNGALATQDGVTLADGDSLWVKDQAAPAQNGIYTVTEIGDGATAFVLTRRTDADTAAELAYAAAFVTAGTDNAGKTFGINLAAAAITVGTTALTAVQMDGPEGVAAVADRLGTTLTLGHVPPASDLVTGLANTTHIPQLPITLAGNIREVTFSLDTPTHISLLLLKKNGDGTYDMLDRMDVWGEAGANTVYDFNPAVMGDGTEYIGVWNDTASLHYSATTGSLEWITGIPTTGTAITNSGSGTDMQIGFIVDAAAQARTAQKLELTPGFAWNVRYTMGGRGDALNFPVALFQPNQRGDGATDGSGCMAVDLCPRGTPMPFSGLIAWYDICDTDIVADKTNYSSLRLAMLDDYVMIGPAAGGTGTLKPLLVNPDGLYTGIGGQITPTCKWDMNSDLMRLRLTKTPASATAAGNQGDICWDANYVYLCIATNTWRRIAHATW